MKFHLIPRPDRATRKVLHIRDIYRDLLAGTGKELHIRYYDKTPNVGDDLNMILISSLQERCTYIQRSGCLPHILGVGSILHFATQKSLVWGSGFISEAIKPKEKVLSEMKVFALRGELSKEVLRPLNADARNCPLGDPAILMPKIYSPTNIQKKFRLGIVPHLADADSPWISVFERIKGVTILRLDQNPILFINRLNECDYIASSSLHGLVLADAYSIPNVRLKLSDRIVGGDFKFKDYYSTTSGFGSTLCIDLRNEHCSCIDTILNQIKDSSMISSYLYESEQLVSALASACSLI